MRVNFVEVWRRLRQAVAIVTSSSLAAFARQIFCHQRPDPRSAGTFTAVLIHRRGQIRRRGRCFWSWGYSFDKRMCLRSGLDCAARPFCPQELTSSGPTACPKSATFGLTHRNKERPLRAGWLETLATRAAISVTAREPAVYPRRNSLLSRRRAHLRRSAGAPHSPSARPVQSRAGFLFSFSSHCRLIGWHPAYG